MNDQTVPQPSDPTHLSSSAQVWDAIVSYAAALEGDPHPVWWVERPIGRSRVDPADASPDPVYTLVARIGGRDVPVQSLFESCPEAVSDLARRSGWSLSLWGQRLEEMVQESILDCTWRAVRDAPAGVSRGFLHRVPPNLFNFTPETNQAYWRALMNHNEASTPPPGLPADHWVRRVKDLLQGPATPEAQAEGVPLIRRLLRYRGPWEFLAQQSLRVWSCDQPSWSPVLDLFEVSYRTFHEGSPLVVQAIEKGWSAGVLGWLEESQATLAAIPLWAHLPEEWKTSWDPEQPTGTLWHWCCARGTPELLADLLEAMPAAIDVRAPDGRTGLHWACACARRDLVDVLLMHGADLSAEDTEGSIPAQMIPPGHDDLFDRLEDLRLGPSSLLPPPSGVAAPVLAASDGPPQVQKTASGASSVASVAPAAVPTSEDPAPPASTDDVDYSGLFPDF